MISSAFLTHKGRILLVLRDDKPGLKDANTWSILGGHQEEDETPIETLRRELGEEISVVPANFAYLQSFVDSWGKDTHLYKTELSEQEVKNLKLGDEGQKLEFFTPDQIQELDLASAYKTLLTDKTFLQNLIN